MMGLVHEFKNFSGGFTPVQQLVRDATADSTDITKGCQMRQIANITFDSSQVKSIMDIIYQRINDQGRRWRHSEKSLELLRFLLCYGSSDVVEWYNKNTHLVQSLCKYQRSGHNGAEISRRIRNAAESVVSLVQNKPRLDRAREEASRKLIERNNADAKKMARERDAVTEMKVPDVETPIALL